MSVIQTIRNKYGKIAGAVIAIALVGFIVSDARNGSFGNLFGGHDSNIMKVNGQKIEPKEYQLMLKQYETLYTMFNKGRPLDDVARAQMNEESVKMAVYETVVAEQCDKLGIQTTEEEKKELIYGVNADPYIQQFQIEGQQIFVNPQTRSFDPQIIKYMEKQLAEDPQKIDPNGKIREQWETVKAYVLRVNRVSKFNAMFTGAVYAPMYLAKRVLTDQNSMAAIRYVKVPYTAVADNEVKVSDDDIKAYMQKHAALYQADQPTRSIEYVSFDIIPSSSDTARALDALMQLKPDFAAAKDNKTFVNNKSDEANSFSEAYFNKRTLLSKFADTLMSLPVGDIYGPYYENGSYKLTKIVDKKTLPDSVKLRHILVRTKERDKEVLSDSAAKSRIDSAVAAIKGGAKFDSIVMIYSEDGEENKKKGGEYTFTLQNRPGIAKEFGDFIFEGKTGESKVVKVSNDNYSGYHYIEILEQKGTAPAVQLATIAKNLVPSDSTVNAIYGKANEFAGKNATAAEFESAIKKQNLDRRIGDNIKVTNFMITGLGPAREVIKWAFEHKVGDVSQVFQLGDQRYVVAKLVSEQDKGMIAITPGNRPQLEQKVREEMKADIIMKKVNGSTSLDAVAQKTGQAVQQADSVVLGGAYVPNLGYEPKVVGYTFDASFQPNTLSPGIKGLGGVYYITVLNKNINPIPEQFLMQMAARQRGMEEGQTRNALGQLLQQTVSEKADVKYNVANF
jgi:peptidyl-prolyl cis-trans isomerase D